METHSHLEGRNVGVTHLCLICWLVLGFVFCGCDDVNLSLLSFFDALGIHALGILLDMQMRVPVNVESVAALFLEEKLFKECLELCFSDCR